MSEISMHIHDCIFYQFELGNNANAAARHICGHLVKVLLRIALVQIDLKGFVKATRHWKIVQGSRRLVQSDNE